MATYTKHFLGPKMKSRICTQHSEANNNSSIPVVHMPVHVPGGMCAPPIRIDVPCMIVLRADLGTVDPNTRRKSNRCRARCTVVYLHGNGTDIGGVAEEAKALSRDLECHVVVPVRLF